MILEEKLALFDGTLPLERARTIPSLWYSDPEIYALECRAIFGQTWLALGRADQVRAAGDYFTANVAGEPVVVVRSEDGVLRAFFNVCRHRAAQVLNEPQGRTDRLRCRYHGWTYDLSGRLRGVPEFDGVADFRREENGLVPIAVDVWGPLVWVHLGAKPPPLADFLSTLSARCANLGDDLGDDLGIEKLRFVERRQYDLACNWKVFVDNYLDGGYHVNTVHPGLAGALDYSQYRTEVFESSSVQISPLKPPDDPTLAKVRTGDNAYYWWIFPNLMINLYAGVMDTNLVLPLGPDRCRVIFDFYFADVDSPDAKQFNAESIAFGHQVQLEDIGICEEVQRGLGSRSYSTGRFSVRREAGGYHFHRLLARRLRDR